MQKPAKILVIGSVPRGELASCIDRINKVNSKSGFDCVLIAGVLEEEKFADITTTPDIPVYFGFSTSKDLDSPDDGEIINNLIYTPSILTLSSGVKAGFFDKSGNTPENVQVDILITRDWPEHIHLGSKIPAPTAPQGNSYVAQLVQALRPRYHFVGTQDIFYEREPFRYRPEEPQQPSENRICRFISLATFGNKSNKWFYAFNLQIQDESLPGNLTASPYDMAKIDVLRNSEGQDNNNNRKDYLISRQPNKRQRTGPGYHHRPPPPPKIVNPESCFFCLSNPSFASELVISIGEESYIAGAKGPLVELNDTTGHVLVIPLTHAATYSDMGDSQQGVMSEMDKFESALVKTFAASWEMATCAFEISRQRNVHIHRQILAIPPQKLGQLKLDFTNMARVNNYPPFKESSSSVADPQTGSEYFRISFYFHPEPQIEKSPPITTFWMPLDGNTKFDLQFPRKVLAHTLNLESRIDWRAVDETPLDLQQTQIDVFKQAFHPFDFT